METIKLNNLNTSFRLHGTETRRSLTIFAVKFPEKQTRQLQLQVLDEKDLTVFTQDLTENGNLEIPVNKTFVFYDHLTVQIHGAGSGPFEADVLYE